MPRGIPRIPRRSVRSPAAAEEVSTAFLLPDLHPWLKEFFATRNLIPIGEETWSRLPTFVPLPAPPTAITALTNELHEAVAVLAGRIGRLAAPPAPPPRRDIAAAAATRIWDSPLNPVTQTGSGERCPPSGPLTTERTRSEAEDRGSEGGRGASVPGGGRPTSAAGLTWCDRRESRENPQLPAPSPQPTPRCILPTGARASTAPIPLLIPIDARSDITTSRNLLRVPRQEPRLAPAPDLLTTIREQFAPVATSVRTTGPRFRAIFAACRERARQPAPALRIPSPFDELLIVNLIAGPIGVLWRSVLWPVVAASGGWRLGTRSWGFLQRRITERQATIDARRMSAPELRTPTFSLPVLRHSLAFACLLALILLPIKFLGWTPTFPTITGRVLSATAVALESFTDGGTALAQGSFADAAAAFDRAREELEALPTAAGPLGRVGFTIGAYLPGSSLRAAERGRRSAIALADASSAVARGLATLAAMDFRQPQANARIQAAAAAFASARTFVTHARDGLALVDPNILATVDGATAELERVERVLPILGALGGVDRPRRILLAFQNPNELRATGGFLGSLALLDVTDGRITALEVPGGGTYDVSGVARVRVQPPEPLRLLRPTWELQDANWFPDFPTTARKLRWFYAASGGPSVDAVVAVNAPVLPELLALTGPVSVRGQTYTATNAIAALTDTVEDPAARRSGQPKAVVGDLAAELLRRLLAFAGTDGTTTTTAATRTTARVALLDRLLRALDERDVLIAFTDDAVQANVVAAGWAGALQPAPHDALAVIHTNVGGGKSDGSMRDDINHRLRILADGTPIVTLRITRLHGGVAGDGTPPSERLAALANVDYLRVYVPRGATLLTADGFEAPPQDAFEDPATDAIPDRDLLAVELNPSIDAGTGIRTTEEFGRTVFGGWLQIPPGDQRSVRLVYRLPWQYTPAATSGIFRSRRGNAQPYSLRIQRQPGTRATVRHTVELEEPWDATWTTENLRSTGPHAWSFEELLTTDRSAGMMISHRE